MNMGMQRLGFSSETIGAFDGMFVNDRKTGRYLFPPTPLEGFAHGRDEILYYDGSRFVPAGFFWTFLPDGNCRTERIFLFGSAVDAMSAFEIRKAPYFRNSIIHAVGPNPEFRLIRTLNERYPSGRFLLCFPDDFTGRICDARVGAFLQGVDVSIRLDQEEVVFRVGRREVVMNQLDLSLSEFGKLSGYRLQSRTLKPKGYRTFLDRVMAGNTRHG